MAGEEPPQLAQAFPDSAAAGAALAARAWTVAVAESCTGGLLGAALTAVPGSSRYVRGGVIAYHDHVKQALLAVDGDLLARHGAVSKEVALAMARGARKRLETDVGVAITGVAGPGSESDGKAAGLVYVAVATPLAEQVVRLGGDRGREPNRAGAVAAALRLILDLV